MTMAAAPVDIEKAVIAALAPLSVAASTRVPNPRPDSFIRVGVVSGPPPTIAVEAPVVLIECWAPDSVAAFNLARDAWALLVDLEKSFVGGAWVLSVQASRPVNFPDPLTTSPRYQFTATVRVALDEVTLSSP